MARRTTPADIYRNLGIALVACLMILVLGPRPRPSRPGELLAGAARAAAAGDPAAALAFVGQAREFEPALAALDTTAALFALQAGDREAAEAYLAEGRARGADATLLSCLESELAVASRYGAAFDLNSQCPMGGIDLDAWLAVGPDQDDMELAALALRSRVESHPEDLRAWEGLAALTALTDPSQVESVVLRAFRPFPQGSQVLDGLLRLARADGEPLSPAERAAQAGELLAAQGDWGLAAAAWTRALELDPAFPQARAFLGLARSMTGGEGLPDLQQAAAEAPGDPLVRMLLGQYWLAQGETAPALRELAFARSLDPENPALVAAYGAALAEAGKVAEAAEAYRQAAEVDPQDASFWSLLAEFSLRHEFEVETLGRAAARNAAALSPDDASALSVLGYIAHLSEGGLLGERLLQRAISLDPDDSLSWYRYGLLLLDQARYGEARAALTAASTLDSSGPIGRLAARSLASLPAQYR